MKHKVPLVKLDLVLADAVFLVVSEVVVNTGDWSLPVVLNYALGRRMEREFH